MGVRYPVLGISSDRQGPTAHTSQRYEQVWVSLLHNIETWVSM